IAINALMLAVLGFGTLFRWLRHRRANDPQRLQREAREKSVRESLAKMDAALKAQDAPRFFTAARQALQEKLATKWELPTNRITRPKIRARLNGNGKGIGSVFQAADEIAYSGRQFTVPDLQRWRAVVKQQLLALS